MQPGCSSANRRRQDWQRWTWDLRQSAPRSSIQESHTPASPRHVTERNIRRVRSHARLWPILGARFVAADSHRGQFGHGFPGKTQPSLPRQAQPRVASPPGRSSRRVTRFTGAAGQVCRTFGEPALGIFGGPAADRAVPDGTCSLAMRCVITPTGHPALTGGPVPRRGGLPPDLPAAGSYQQHPAQLQAAPGRSPTQAYLICAANRLRRTTDSAHLGGCSRITANAHSRVLSSLPARRSVGEEHFARARDRCCGGWAVRSQAAGHVGSRV